VDEPLAFDLLCCPEMNDLAELAVAPVVREPQVRALHFPLGLLGFEKLKRFELISNPGEEPFKWLQALDDPSLAFLVVPPFEAVQVYQPDISDDDVRSLNLESAEDALLFGIVTLHRNGQATVNLKGPIVVNRHTWKAKQVVLMNAGKYEVQQPILVSAD